MSRYTQVSGDRSQVSTIINDQEESCSPGSGSGQLTHGYGSEASITGDNFFSRSFILNELWGGRSCAIYENLCAGCGYGVFESKGKLCNFCQFVVNGCFEEDNIYENICVKCGEIFSGKECDLCSSSPTKQFKKSKKATRILSGIFETLKRVKSRDKNTKPRKLEIVHNVDGFHNVFKTNETFDLNRICELKRLQSSSDQHIYGKLRRSDDHLMNSFGSCTQSLAANSKSDPTLHKIVKSRTSSRLGVSAVNKQSADKKVHTFFQDSVIEWMTSLRSQTFDYGSVPDDTICNTKSIPSRNFSCCGFVHEIGSWEFLSGEEATLRSLFTNDQDCTQMVDDFKRNLMDKQRSKRRAIYLKIDEPPQVSNTSTPDSVRGSLRQSSRRYGFYEKNSDFVNDLLSAFDAFLSRDQVSNDPNAEVAADSAIVEKTPPEAVQETDLVEPIKNPRTDINSNENSAIEVLASEAIGRQIDIAGIIAELAISRSLNRIVITYDRQLSAFLKVVNTREFGVFDFQQLLRLFTQVSLKLAPKIRKKDKFKQRNDRAIAHESCTPMTVQPKEEDIYQPIWKFKTVGNPRESYASDYYDITAYDSSRVEDHGEWETDDEFMFSTKMKEVNQDDELRSTKISSTNDTESENSLYVRSGDPYQSVCIFYSPAVPKIRAIVYNYDRRHSYFASQSDATRSGCDLRPPVPLQVPLEVANRPPACHKTSIRNESVPDCVQAWKFMLLDINYIDDEEDMYVTENEILKLKQIESESLSGATLQRFKSVSSDNLLDIPQDKKSIGERFRNKLQRGVLKLNSKQPKDKKGKSNFKRSDSTSLYLEEGIKPKYPIFGAPLNEVEMDPAECSVPRFVADCIRYIEQKESIQIDGLYRASGNKVAIDELKKKLTESYIYDSRLLKNEDVHTITGLLKLFFRELQTPLIPQELYKKLPENLVESSNLPAIKKTLLEIPNPSLGTLKFLLKHLTIVAHYCHENRMPASNLAIIWGPCLLFSSSTGPFEIARMNTLTKVLIENYDAIFGDNERLVN